MLHRATTLTLCIAALAPLSAPSLEDVHQKRRETLQELSLLLESQGPEQTLARVRELQKQDPRRENWLEYALYAIAVVHFDQKRDEACAALLHEIVGDYGKTRVASAAMFGLAQLHARKGEEAKQLEWFKRCALFEWTYSGYTSIMDVCDTRSEAVMFLAKHHETRKEWLEASEWWKKYRPDTGCGTCNGGLEGWRDARRATCLAHLGRHAEAAEICWRTLLVEKNEFSDEPAVFLFRLYKQAGQLDDLLRIVEGFEDREVDRLRKLEFYKNEPRAEIIRLFTTDPLRRLVNGTYRPKQNRSVPDAVFPAPKAGSLPKRFSS